MATTSLPSEHRVHIDHGAGHPYLVVAVDQQGRITRVHSRWATREQALKAVAA